MIPQISHRYSRIVVMVEYSCCRVSQQSKCRAFDGATLRACSCHWTKYCSALKSASCESSSNGHYADYGVAWHGNAQPHDLVFPNGKGKPDGHFLRKLKVIEKNAGIEGAELHRFHKTYDDTLHEEGVSVNTIRIRLGHESLDVTLAYLKGKDAESEEAQEHANSSSLALYA